MDEEKIVAAILACGALAEINPKSESYVEEYQKILAMLRSRKAAEKPPMKIGEDALSWSKGKPQT